MISEQGFQKCRSDSCLLVYKFNRKYILLMKILVYNALVLV